MTQLIQEYIGKECLIYTMDSQITGTILAAEGNWITVNSGQEREIVNADFIVRIRPHPVTKKGKKKSVVLD